ncbi:hypothetical protein ACFQZC_36455 [Streptacidiphilus monticola]
MARPYDRGPGRKPGQLSWGTGATPSFFGPGDGTEYVTITDNAAPHENLLVYRVAGGPTPVCTTPVLTQYAASGTEDAVIASGSSVFVTDTYGYPYPALPAGAPPASPRRPRSRAASAASTSTPAERAATPSGTATSSRLPCPGFHSPTERSTPSL